MIPDRYGDKDWQGVPCDDPAELVGVDYVEAEDDRPELWEVADLPGTWLFTSEPKRAAS